ncbi:MAG: hypothetical protein JXB03_00220, partial [Spirochaetales bacterium]|nr:hypothetical protein [Spirochaetales bacterium]
HGRTDEVCLRFKYETSMNELYLNRTLRTLISNAVDLYLADFENRKLQENEYKTRYAYGKKNGRLRWGAFQMRADAEPEIQFGYKFQYDSPYFVLVIKEGSNTNENSYDKILSNIEMILYFTKAQAIALKEVLGQDYILSLIKEQDIPQASTEPDEY